MMRLYGGAYIGINRLSIGERCEIANPIGGGDAEKPRFKNRRIGLTTSGFFGHSDHFLDDGQSPGRFGANMVSYSAY